MHLTQPNFNKLARKLRKGNQGAGEEIFDYFSPKIFRFFMVRILHRETAEDLTQNVFLKLVKKIDTFNPAVGNFSSWLWQIAKNTLIDYFREKKSLPFSDLDLAAQKSLVNKDAGFGDPAEDFKLKEILQIVEKFSKEEQEIFSLHYLSDLPYKELSKMLNKSEGSLRVLVHRINQKIKSIINDQNNKRENK